MGTAVLRGGRLVEELSGLRDLATGCPAALGTRVLTEEEARSWHRPALVDRHTHDHGAAHRWLIDAWLALDLLGRWVERVVHVSGALAGRDRELDASLTRWLHSASAARADGLLPVHVSCVAYLRGLDARRAPPLLVGIPASSSRAVVMDAVSWWVAAGGRCAGLARAPRLSARRATATSRQQPLRPAPILRPGEPRDAAARRRGVGRAWTVLARSGGDSAASASVIAEGRGAKSMTHLELLDVSARLDDVRQDDEALAAGCRLARQHVAAEHVAIIRRQDGVLQVLASDGDQGDSGHVWPHLCGNDTPALLTSASGWHAAAHHTGDDGSVWMGGRWDSSDRAVAGQELLSVFARLIAARVPRTPAPPIGAPALEHTLVGDSVIMRDVRAQIALAARAPFPVLIRGESGCGKELAARAIHALGARRHRRCAAINCAALPDELIESELFGHVRGAFTGAAADRAGLFDDADGGTLFLDEVGELGARAQAKLLRVLQDGEVRRVGENHARRVDVRVIAATNVSLEDAVRHGAFRADLFYRLDVVRVRMPALRERPDDVPVLARHFWHECTARVGSRARLEGRVLEALARYDWPGNVRQLQNALAALAVRVPARGRVTLDDLPPELRPSGGVLPGARAGLEAARREFEATYVRDALSRAGGRPTMAARDLGVTRQGLSKLVRRLGLDDPGASSRLP